MTLIEIRPHRWGWKAFESPGVEPVFPKKDQAIDYAQNRAYFRSGEIRVLNSNGKVERTIPFNETEQYNRRDDLLHRRTSERCLISLTIFPLLASLCWALGLQSVHPTIEQGFV